MRFMSSAWDGGLATSYDGKSHSISTSGNRNGLATSYDWKVAFHHDGMRLQRTGDELRLESRFLSIPKPPATATKPY